MRFPQPLARGRLVRRYKRFLADVAPDGALEAATVHVPNPGAMLGLAAPGDVVWLSRSSSPTRKLPLTLELVEVAGTPVGVNTLAANALVAEALAAGAMAPLVGYASARREVRYGDASRVDFLLEHPGPPARRPAWVEVKSVTLSRSPGLAEWPDCRSTRATQHVRELAERAAAGDRAVVLFVIQRADCDRFRVAADLDPDFAAALQAARGVETYAYACDVGPCGLTISREVRTT